MAQKTVEKSEFRVIKRMSADCTIYVAEDTNADYVVVKDDLLQATFEHQQDAYRLFGILTRAQKEE